MADSMLYLTYIAVILFFGLLSYIISKKIKVPHIIVLILIGILIKNMSYEGVPYIEFPTVFLTSIAILTLAMIVFDSTSRLNIKEFDEFSMSTLKLTFIFFILTFTALAFATYILYGRNISIPICLIFSSIMAGTSPDVVLSMMKESKNRVVELLKVESIINTPMIVIVPFVILELIQNVESVSSMDILMEQMKPFLLKIVAGVGAGIVIFIIIFKFLRAQSSPSLSSLAVTASAIMSYILAENIGGNGVLAVTTLGLSLGNVYIRQKGALQEFSGLFSNFLEILVFVMVGLIIELPLTLGFFLKSISLFIIFLVIRFFSVQISLSEYNMKEKIFMTINAPKGIAVAVVVFTLATYSLEGISMILDLSLAFLLYSIILSSIVAKFSQYFIRAKIIK